MWATMVVFVMAALTGFYMLPAERGRIAVEQRQARELAESMALYRQAVVSYYSANDVTGASIGIDTLKAAGVVPSWSALYTRSAQAIWGNYRDSAGVIYIYPATPAPRNIVGEVLALSGNSLNVGIYRASDRSLYAPADGTRVALAPQAAAAIPDGALVWLAARE
jgi:hypothetical protein